MSEGKLDLKGFDYENLYFPEGRLDLEVLRGVAADPRFGFLRLAPDDVLEILYSWADSLDEDESLVADAIEAEIKRRQEGAG